MKRSPDLKYEELVFLQMAQVLRKHLEACFGGKVRDTFVYPHHVKVDFNNAFRFVWLLQVRFERLYCKHSRAQNNHPN